MENRGSLLERKIQGSSKQNLYKSMAIKENHIKLYNSFIKEYFSPFSLDPIFYSKAEKLLTRDDIVIDNKNVYVFFVKGLSAKEINTLKIHIINNFLINWNEYSEYIYYICPTEFNHLTITSFTADTLFNRGFEKELIDSSDLFSDIQFISITPNVKDHRKGYYDYVIGSHISSRNEFGLVTILLYFGTPADYEVNNYDEVMNMTRMVKKYTDLITVNNTQTNISELGESNCVVKESKKTKRNIMKTKVPDIDMFETHYE